MKINLDRFCPHLFIFGIEKDYMSNKVPVVILNGFLGSGKTTMFKSLLSQCINKNIVASAIVNDMSELDVDGELISNILEEDNSQIFNSISSCVLSSKKGIKKLDQSILNSIENNPEIIIIETCL